ncbi:complement C1q-like protein 2 [Megalops cyprinoides]|uniref:complement C1q-like protein 2 n=1 Tax=Megalops cyprinoides TaxID=118141 RepID=UPI001864E912|nr:complement C1q-like protein 2 [Megalops cyprinoides]
MRNAAVSWQGQFPCDNWDCECVFKRQSGCCCVTQRMHTLEEQVFMRLKALWKELSYLEDSVTEVTGGLKVAFTVFMGSTAGCFGPFTSNVPIPYSIISLNQGNGYNPALGAFTAPRSGLYSFTFTAYSNVGPAGSRLYHEVRLMKDGQVVASVWEDNREDSEDSGTQTVLLTLRRGSQVHVELLSGRHLCADTAEHNTFSGYLLYPTLEA